MENELKKDFTRRLSQCNSGEMIVIIYDIFFAYVDDIRQAHCKGDHDGQKDAIRNAQSVLDELIGSLNFSYPISHNLYKLYMFCKNELSRAMYENRLDGVQEAEHIMHRLYTSFPASLFPYCSSRWWPAVCSLRASSGLYHVPLAAEL